MSKKQIDIFVLVYGPYRNDEKQIIGCYSSKQNATLAAIEEMTATFNTNEDSIDEDELTQALAENDCYKKDGGTLVEIVKFQLDKDQ